MALNIKALATELDDLRDREGEEDAEPLDADEQERLAALTKLEDELGDLHVYSRQGDPLIADSDFEDYARDLAEDLHGRATEWPFTCIDWAQAARELQHDYTSIEFDGETYYYRA